mgnify:CR=1 FL=1
MSQADRNNDVMVCRCRDVTEEEIKKAISEGYDTLELLKMKTKVGTGTCGGRTCLPIVKRIMSRETGRKPQDMDLPQERSPIIPVPLRFAAGEKDGDSND